MRETPTGTAQNESLMKEIGIMLNNYLNGAPKRSVKAAGKVNRRPVTGPHKSLPTLPAGSGSRLFTVHRR